MRLGAILCLALLAGCSSYADRVAATCTRLGFAPGTGRYWDCVQQQQALDAADRAGWAGVTMAGAGIIAASQPTVVILP